jgi:SPP1 gp7 family putative phage head morphogenesis protein
MPISLLTAGDFVPMPASQAAKRFKDKAALTSDTFERLSKAARQRAFRIAGVHKVRVIQRARDVVHKAIREGTDFRTARDELLKIFEEEELPRPSLAHLRLVIGQNTAQAYNEARREMMNEVIDAFPYWQYMTVGDAQVRASHAALDGLVFRADDQFWDAHYPPWEFGCRCTVIALTRGQIAERGIEVRNLGYVRTELGVKANPEFSADDVDLSGVDEELRRALEEDLKMNGESHGNGRFEIRGPLQWAVNQETGEPLKEIMLAPWGQVTTDNGPILVDAEGMALTLADFGKRGSRPVDLDHASIQSWCAPLDRRAVGHVEKLEVREGSGLFGRVKWNEEGVELIRADSFRYISPVFRVDGEERRVVRFHSAALTNTPAIRGMPRVAAAENIQESQMIETNEKAVRTNSMLVQLAEKLGTRADAADPAASLPQMVTAAEKLRSDLTALSSIKTALGLKEEAGTAEVGTTIHTLKLAADELKGLKTKVVELESSAAKQKAAELLAPYKAKGVISEANKEDFEFFCELAVTKPAVCKQQLDARVALLGPSGKTTPPPGDSTAAGGKSREQIIAHSAAEYDKGGNEGRLTDKTSFVNLALKDAKIPAMTDQEKTQLLAA